LGYSDGYTEGESIGYAEGYEAGTAASEAACDITSDNEAVCTGAGGTWSESGCFFEGGECEPYDNAFICTCRFTDTHEDGYDDSSYDQGFMAGIYSIDIEADNPSVCLEYGGLWDPVSGCVSADCMYQDEDGDMFDDASYQAGVDSALEGAPSCGSDTLWNGQACVTPTSQMPHCWQAAFCYTAHSQWGTGLPQAQAGPMDQATCQADPDADNFELWNIGEAMVMGAESGNVYYRFSLGALCTEAS